MMADKRAVDLVPGDVIHEPPFLPYRKVTSVRQYEGWVAVEFDPTGAVAFDNNRWVEIHAPS